MLASTTTPAMSRIRVRGAGRSTPRSRKRCRPTCSPPRFMRGSVRAIRKASRSVCFRRCAKASAAMSNRKPPALPALKGNPMALSREARAVRQANPCCFVVFGASGDLTARLLGAAIYRLAAQKRLPDGFAIIGLAHSHRSDEEFRNNLKRALDEHVSEKTDPDTVAWLLERTSYVQGEFEDPATYDRLDRALKSVEGERRIPGNRLFYLATPPSAFVPIVKRLGEKG